MEISLLQAFALGIIAFIAGLDMFNGLTHMHRPVVLGPLVGLVLGDLHTGILTGGTLELVWMGLAPLAGVPVPVAAAAGYFCRAAENHDEKRLHPLLHPGLCCRSLAQVTGAGYCCRCAGDGADRPAA